MLIVRTGRQVMTSVQSILLSVASRRVGAHCCAAAVRSNNPQQVGPSETTENKLSLGQLTTNFGKPMIHTFNPLSVNTWEGVSHCQLVGLSQCLVHSEHESWL